MPPLDDNIEDLVSSTDPALDAQAAPPSQENAADAAKSSAATEDEKPFDPLSIVRDAVDARKKDDPAPASSADGEDNSEGQPGEPKKQDDEEYSDVPFHKHPRFQQLLRKSKAYEQDAVRYQNVQGFLDQAGLSSEEAADGLAIMGLMKTNPSEAWRRLQPAVQKLLIAAGEVIPDDLQQRVQSGEMSREAAQELSRARAAAQNVTAAQSFREQQAARRQQTETVSAVQSAAQVWEDDRRTKDPNFDAKYVDLQKEVAWLLRTEGQPTTPQGVRAQLKKAYDTVSARIAPPPPAPPRRPAIRPITGGQVAGGQPLPANASTLDIVRAHRRG